MHPALRRSLTAVSLGLVAAGLALGGPGSVSAAPASTPLDGLVTNVVEPVNQVVTPVLGPLLDGGQAPGQAGPTGPPQPPPSPSPGVSPPAAPVSAQVSPHGSIGSPATAGRATPGDTAAVPAVARGFARAGSLRGHSGGARRVLRSGRPTPSTSPSGLLTQPARSNHPSVLTRIDHAVPTAIKVAMGALALLVLGLAVTTLVGRRRLASERLRADTDVLTGLSNHRCIQETLHRMFAYAWRTGNPLAAVVLDLDYFKAINDTYGHAKGDEVLTSVGDAIRRTLRGSDFAGRYGGEEFVVLLPDTDEAGAMTAAEKLRETLKATTIPGLECAITGSFGVAASSGGYETAEQMLSAADHALYRAKAGGRDTIQAADHPSSGRPLAACAV